ncbi:SF1B family DNA helicase RecD2 [Salimicrobium halophilum]|uniref:ATP-dependent RecD2 DNA helicase n=1 Tax=Salimicrobium halophilum TaxID=86666 RepID=A0A1G8PNZ5_9BACI|nr:ATP-dependent RecD-like DNA helicase [Salimicrobium halophilum]SDI93560.1 ATP-dependent DNA helicase, RecD/TraA family [Salimicrobium halophilum]
MDNENVTMEPEEKPYVKVELKRMIFHKEEESFSIASVKVLETTEDLKEKELVVKGYFSPLEEGEAYILYGYFETHKKFGEQYVVEGYRRVMPETKDGLITYLSSDLFEGVGKKTARRIVDTLGEGAVSRILSDKKVLDEVPKMSRTIKDKLYQTLQEHQGFEQVMVELTKHGLGLKTIQKIYGAFGDKTLEILEEDPYQFVFTVEGFGFHRADELAKQQDLTDDHPTRIRAGCLYSLHQNLQAGHVYLPLETCILEMEQLLQTSGKETLTYEKLAEEITHLGEEKFVFIEEDRIYLPSLYFAENGFTSQVDRIISEEVEVEFTQADLLKVIGAIEEEETMSYGKEQFEAIETALKQKMMIITGGPGTGKTTVIKGLLHAYSKLMDYSLDPKDYTKDFAFPFVLAAPTGRAAKRMTESTGLPASTIHRLLGWDGHQTFEKNHTNQLEGKLLIIDEFSMVDMWLSNQLFRAIPSDMQVVVVGDEDQLPSVGPGQVLADLLASNVLPSIQLSEVYRQKEGSKIIHLAHAIKNDTCTAEMLTKEKDFNFIQAPDMQLKDVVTDIVAKAHEKSIDLRDIQVLAPMYRTETGIHELNRSLQSRVNPKKKNKREMEWKGNVFRKGDKVIQLVNQPEENVFNGDIGEVVAIFRAEENVDQVEQVVVEFDGKEVTYPKKELGNIMLAYCTSIHKSQGSEFSIVVLPVTYQYNRMLKKNLLYTAVTRAKQSLILCGTPQAFLKGISTKDTNQRFTYLQEKLRKETPVTYDEEEEEDAISPYDFM